MAKRGGSTLTSATTRSVSLPQGANREFGTWAYISPEQKRGESATRASDWYSVGVVIHEALLGVQPDDELRPPHEVGEWVPRDLSRLCQRLLARDPNQRPTGRQLLEAVGAAPSTLGITGTPPTIQEKPFVGRRSQLEQLEKKFEHARKKRRATVAVLTGESGMGKTAILEQFLRERRQDAIVLRGRCYEHDSVPYKALNGVVDSLADILNTFGDREVDSLIQGEFNEPVQLARLFPVLHEVKQIRSASERTPPANGANPQDEQG